MAKRVSDVTDEASPRIVGKAVLAEILDVNINTIDNWSARGMPIWRRGGPGNPNMYDIAAVVKWRVETEVARVDGRGDTVTQMDEAKRRKMLADAITAELDLAERQRELVSIEVVGRIIDDEYANVRTRILNLRSLAPRLANITDANEIDRILHTAVSEALEELSADQDVDAAYDKMQLRLKGGDAGRA